MSLWEKDRTNVMGMLKGGLKERRDSHVGPNQSKSHQSLHTCPTVHQTLCWDPCVSLLIFTITHGGRHILTALGRKMKLKEKILAQDYTGSE